MKHPSRQRRVAPTVIAAFLALTIPACGNATGDLIDGSQWEMTEVVSGGAITGAHPTTIATAVFADGIMAGSTGCNRYQASYRVENDSISIGDVALTGGACDPDHLDQGEAFSRALESTSRFSVSDGELELTDATGAVQLRFRPAMDLPLAGITWRLLWYGDGTAPLDGSTISLTFGGDGMLSGTAGCNGYGADYRLEGDTVMVGAIAHTEMACQEPAGVMDQEREYLAMLRTVAGFATTLTGLELLDADDRPVAEYRFAGRVR